MRSNIWRHILYFRALKSLFLLFYTFLHTLFDIHQPGSYAPNMAENEIIDLGHRLRWQRTRRALQNAECPVDEVVAAMAADMEGVCAGLPKALKKGPPLKALLELSIGSNLQVQAVIAQFTEKGLASLVNDARKQCGSNSASAVAAAAARLLIDRLIDQIECRAGREERFRSSEARSELIAQATKAFRGYERDLQAILEAALGDGPMVRFKRRLTQKPRMSARQLLNVSIVPVPPSSIPETSRAR